MTARKGVTKTAAAKAVPTTIPKKAAPKKPAQDRRQEKADPPYTSKLLLTVAQAADSLQISERKMWDMVGRKVIRSIKPDGRSRRIPLSALHEYINAQLTLSA